MAFSDDFTGTTGQKLSARTGWTLAFGTDCFEVRSNGQLGKPATSANALNVYYRDDDGATTQAVKLDFASASTTVGAFVLGSGADAASFNCYYFRYSSATAVRVNRINNGTLDGSSIITASGLADVLEAELRVSINGDGNPVLQVYSHGVAVGSSYTDTSVNKKTSGRRGVLSNATSAASFAFDNYSDDYSPSSGFAITERAAVFVWEGIRQTSSFSYEGTYTGTPTSIEARIVDDNGDAVTGFDWATKDASPSGEEFTVSFSGLPIGGPYRVQVRDGGNHAAVEEGANDFYVGGVVVPWGQSQCNYLGTIDVGGESATAGVKASFLNLASETDPGSPSLSQISAAAGSIGSGIVALANQWHLDTGGVPLMIVDCTIGGTSINQWVSGATPGGMSWSLHEYRTAMLSAAANQASAVVFFQGTSNVGSQTGYADLMDDLADQFEAELPGQDPLFIVMPHPRSNDGENTWALRNIQYGKAISGGRWRLGGWLLDWVMDSDSSPHQADGATGNIRGGTRIGRVIAKHLDDSSLDVLGPQISTCKFTDGTRNVIELTFDRDIKLADGSAYVDTPIALPIHSFSVSTDSGSTFSMTGNSSAITAVRKVQVTKDSGSWSESTTRVDYLRGIPWSSDTDDTTEYVGPEADMEADFLSQVITDTTSFDGGRGMPMAPVMGTGRAVAEFDAPAATAGVQLADTEDGYVGLLRTL